MTAPLLSVPILTPYKWQLEYLFYLNTFFRFDWTYKSKWLVTHQPLEVL